MVIFTQNNAVDDPSKLEACKNITEDDRDVDTQWSSLSIQDAGGTSLGWNRRRMTILSHCPLVCLHHFTHGGTQTLEVVVDNAYAEHTSSRSSIHHKHYYLMKYKKYANYKLTNYYQ